MNKLYFEEPEETLAYLQDYYFPPYITLAHMFHAPHGWELQQRALKQYQFQYVVEGAAEYSIGDRTYTTVKGDLIFHRPNELHSLKMMEGQSYVCISIVFHFGGADVPMNELIPVGAHHLGNYAKHPIDGMLSEIVLHYQHPGWSRHLQCQQLLLQALTALRDAVRGDRERSAHIRKQSGSAKLIVMRNFIDGRVKEGFTLDELQALSGWSKNHIIMEFKKAFHMSPFAYLVRARMELAKQLALQSGLTVSEIAQQVGYSDVHSFGKTFKRKTGMSLSQFCGNLFMDTPDR